MNPKRVCLLALALGGALWSAELAAQSLPGPGAHEARVTVSIRLTGAFVYYVMPPPPPRTIHVLPGATIHFSQWIPEGELLEIEWMKDGVSLGVTTPAFELTYVETGDSGLYSARIRTAQGDWQYTPVPVRVATAGRQLLNLSARGTITPASPVLIGGFVIASDPRGAAVIGRSVLVRAVGPSLTTVGVPNPLALPRLKLFRADGTELIQARTQDAAYTTPAEVAVAVGAFPLLPGSADAAEIFTLPAGCFTAHVTSGDGGSGDVLLEVYEIPDDLALWHSP